MWPLLVLSIFTLAVVLESLFRLYRAGVLGAKGRAAGELIDDGKLQSLVDLFPGHAVSRVLTRVSALQGSEFEAAAGSAAGRALQELGRGAAFLDTAVTLSPLLGLLGTVTGLIQSFGLLGSEQLGAPAVITGGIAESLIATGFGLAVAIAALVPLNFLNAKIESLRFDLEAALNKLSMRGGLNINRAA